MKRSLGAVVLATCLTGCGGQSGENELTTCRGATFEDVDPDDATLGFTAEEALAAMPRPTSVLWASEDLGLAEDVVTLELRISGQVQLVDFSESVDRCDRGRELRIPVSADVDVGGGGIVVADGTLDLWARGASAADITPDSSRGLPVALDGTYAEAFDTWWADQQARYPDATQWELQGVYLSIMPMWDSPSISVDADYRSSNGDGISMVWYGDFAFAE